jgi:catechol 2,3-dioxygenase-like lactoylglutathione lyase family enzyme
VLAVPDVQKSAAYFRDILGFRLLWEDAADWRLVERDGVRVMLGHCPNDMRAAEIGSHNWFGYLSVDDVDALFEELTARGAACSPPRDTHYRMREIVVTTIDGHRLVFGQDLPAG